MSNVGESDSITIGVTGIWWTGTTLVGTDQRFNQSKAWNHSGSSCCYDVWNVAAHETGHSIGLDDITGSSHEELSMYGSTYPGDVKRRTLARGDILGMRAKY